MLAPVTSSVPPTVVLPVIFATPFTLKSFREANRLTFKSPNVNLLFADVITKFLLESNLILATIPELPLISNPEPTASASVPPLFNVINASLIIVLVVSIL